MNPGKSHTKVNDRRSKLGIRIKWGQGITKPSTCLAVIPGHKNIDYLLFAGNNDGCKPLFPVVMIPDLPPAVRTAVKQGKFHPFQSGKCILNNRCNKRWYFYTLHGRPSEQVSPISSVQETIELSSFVLRRRVKRDLRSEYLPG